jgi:tetraacyldisaccharide-1-P 4'-kinase
MLNKIAPNSSRITYDKKNMNYLNVASIEGLNQVFLKMYKDKMEIFRNDYFKDHREIKNQTAKWF